MRLVGCDEQLWRVVWRLDGACLGCLALSVQVLSSGVLLRGGDRLLTGCRRRVLADVADVHMKIVTFL